MRTSQTDLLADFNGEAQISGANSKTGVQNLPAPRNLSTETAKPPMNTPGATDTAPEAREKPAVIKGKESFRRRLWGGNSEGFYEKIIGTWSSELSPQGHSRCPLNTECFKKKKKKTKIFFFRC